MLEIRPGNGCSEEASTWEQSYTQGVDIHNYLMILIVVDASEVIIAQSIGIL